MCRPAPAPVGRRSLNRPYRDAVEQENGENDGVNDRLTNVFLHQPDVVDYAQDRGDINKPVERLPALAKFANRPLRRSSGQRNHQYKCRKTYRDERALVDVFIDAMQVEKLVEPDVGGEVQAAVKKREQSEHPPVLDEPVLPGQ